MAKARQNGGTVTLVDVAQLAGVSMKTVSRVVNREARVAEPTAARVRQAVRELGYVPNNAARSLAGRRSWLIGMLYDNLSYNWVSEVQRGAVKAAIEHGYDLVMKPCNPRSETSLADLRRLMESGNLDGLILTPPYPDEGLTEMLLSLGLPFVQIDPEPGEKRSLAIRIDSRAGALAVTRHLIGLGHRRIAFVRGDPLQNASRERYQGFEQGLREAGVEPDPGLILPGDFSFESGVRAGEVIAALAEKPTAVFASNDDMALGVLQALQRGGYRCPADISVAGFDDIEAAQRVWPPLTTVRQPTEEIARQAVKMLIDAIDEPGREQPREVRVGTSFIRRESTEVPATGGN